MLSARLAHANYPVANYGINTDLTAEDRAFENTLLWFKALGVRAVAVSGPGSTEVYKPFYHPGKFEGRLPVLARRWRCDLRRALGTLFTGTRDGLSRPGAALAGARCGYGRVGFVRGGD